MKLKHLAFQTFNFFLTSGVGWMIDMFVYISLSNFTNDIVFSNVISSICGVTFVFVVSTRKNFVSNNVKIGLRTKYVLYLIYQAGLIFIASIAIAWLSTKLLSVGILFVVHYPKLVAKIIITPLTMILNFIVMKILVEKI